jgi:hypothetical protein
MSDHHEEHSTRRRRDMDLLTDPIRWLRNRSLPLLAFMLIVMLAYPYFDVPGKSSPDVIVVAFASIPVFGVLTLGRVRWGMACALILILALILAKMAESPDTEALVSGWVGLLVIGVYLLNIIIIGKSVLQSMSLLVDRVYGGMAVYMLIAIMFAVIHHRIGVRTLDAYRNVAKTDSGPLNWADYIYFSFSAFTTAGFGDIVPTNAFSRCMASLESVVGVLYPAVLIARLINRDFAPARN